ncbi:dockerin type I domain-containing protein [Haladaptatus sp. CMAA 1911]|uniref:dockerin type I domain-containing protein n=1 Tax=unclassified Haladaptatus TaxID=2622732 RepID=UPI0037549CD4
MKDRKRSHDSSNRLKNRTPLLRVFTLVLMVGMVIGAPAVGTVGLVGAASQQAATVNVSDATVSTGDTTAVDVSMSDVPTGLSGYDITLSLDDGSVATITNASVSDSFGISDVEVSDDGSSVHLRGLDLNNETQPGASGVSLASVEVKGNSAGTATLSVENVTRVDDDDGNSISVNSSSGQISVESPNQSTPTVSVGDATVEEGSSTSTQVMMSSAPNGLAGYDVTLGLADGSVANITGASVDGAFGISEVVIGEDNSTVRLRGVDLNETIQSGATNISLASVEIEGGSAGMTALNVQSVSNADDDEGNAINPETDSGQITVEEQAPPGDGNESSADVSVELERNHITDDNTTTADVVVSEVPEGLSGFNMTVGVSGSAEIVGASYGDDLDLNLAPEFGDDRKTVMLRAVDIEKNIEPGAENVTIATVELRGTEDGNANVNVTDVDRFEDDSGNSIAVNASGDQLSVHHVIPVTGAQLPTDPDGDGMYEDVDGDGSVTYNDVVVLFQNFNDAAIQQYSEEYDFDGSGEVSYNDIVSLFQSMGQAA